MSADIPERFSRRGEGVAVSILEEEAELLRSIPAELRPVLEAPLDRNNPVSDRLFPRAYLDPTEEGAEREWQDLVRPELVRERLAALDRLAESLQRGQVRDGRVEVELDGDEAHAWLGALNDARLALGTRLGVTEDLDYDNVPDDHPDAPAYAVYGWLTWLEGDLVESLLG